MEWIPIYVFNLSFLEEIIEKLLSVEDGVEMGKHSDSTVHTNCNASNLATHANVQGRVSSWIFYGGGGREGIRTQSANFQ